MERYFGINYEFSRAKIYEKIDQTIASGAKGYVCAVEGNVLTETKLDSAYRDIVNHSMFSICDSSWVPMFIRWIHHVKVQPYQGPQMFIDMVKMQKYQMYFLGSDSTTLSALRSNLQQYDPRIANMPFRDLPFCAVEEFEYESIAEDINHENPDVIWVSLGAPKQEQFVYRLEPFLKRGVMVAVGAAFKFHCGIPRLQRAPKWVINMHLEFLYRLFQEPKKQFRRLKKIISTLPSILREEIVALSLLK